MNHRTFAQTLHLLCERDGMVKPRTGKPAPSILARRTSLNQPTVTRMLRGDSESPTDENGRKLCRAFRVSREQLVGREQIAGIDIPSGQIPEKSWTGEGDSAKPGHMPILSWEQVVTWLNDPLSFDLKGVGEWHPTQPNAGPNSFALRVKGDGMVSMNGGARSYPEGAIIFVDPDIKPRPGRRVIASVAGSLTFKALVEDLGITYLKPVNPTYPLLPVDKSVSLLATVFGTYIPE